MKSEPLENYKGIVVLINILNGGIDAQRRIEEYRTEMIAKEEIEQLRESQIVRGNFISDGEPRKDQKESLVKTMPKNQKFGDSDGLIIQSIGGTTQQSKRISEEESDIFNDGLTQEDIRKFQQMHPDTSFGVKKRVMDQQRRLKNQDEAVTLGKGKTPIVKVNSLAKKALQGINKIKEERDNKLLQDKQAQDLKKLKEEKTRQELNRELDWRRGRSANNDRLATYEIGESFSNLRSNQTSEIDNFVLVNPSEGKEENLEKEYLNLLLVRHKNPLNHLFIKYANSITHKNRNTFDAIEQRAGSMTLAELNKLLADFNLSHLISKAESAQLVRKINQHIFQKQDLKLVDYDTFLRYLINAAVLIHSRPPIFKPHYSYSLMLSSLFEMLDLARKKRGEEQPNFSRKQEKETIQYIQQKDLIELMNQKLVEDPNYTIPPTFKKIYEREVELKYEMPLIKGVKPSYLMCYEILHDIINETFSVQLIEPQAKFFYITKVKLKDEFLRKDAPPVDEKKIVNQHGSRIKIMPRSNQPNGVELKNQISLKIPEKNSLNIISNLSDAQSIKSEAQKDGLKTSQNVLESKKTVSMMSEEDIIPKKSHEEKPNLLEQNQIAVNQDSQLSRRVTRQMSNISKSRKTPGSVMNKALQEKIKREEQQKLEEQKREDQRLRRMKELEKKLSDLKQNKEQIEKSQRDKEKNTELEKMEISKVKDEQRRLRNESLKKKLEEYKLKQKEEKDALAKKNLQLKQEEQAKKSQAAKTFVEQQKLKLKEKFENDAKLRAQSRQQQERNQTLQKQKEQEKKKKLESLFADDREKRKRQQEFNLKISALQKSEAIQEVFRRFDMQLKYVFKHYIDLVSDKNVISQGLQNSGDILHYKNFVAFASQIGVVPALLSLNELKLVYRSTTRHKELQEELPIGLGYSAFQEILLRVAIKSKDLMNKIYEDGLQKGQKPESAKGKKSTQDANQDEKDLKDFTIEKHAEDTYSDIESVNHKTLEGLFVFMELPATKNQLVDKLNSLRTENAKIVPRRLLKKEFETKFSELQAKPDRSQSNKKNPESLPNKNSSAKVEVPNPEKPSKGQKDEGKSQDKKNQPNDDSRKKDDGQKSKSKTELEPKPKKKKTKDDDQDEDENQEDEEEEPKKRKKKKKKTIKEE